jgi:hypothetical protein
MTPAVWIILALVALFAMALLSRRRGDRPPSSEQGEREREPAFPPVPPLEPGEQYDTTVKLATVPNAPMAELWCSRLREEGIEAFQKGAPMLPGLYGGSAANPGMPTEVWVGQHNVERARELFPELGSA